jgi:hypothetical protein
MKHYRSIEKVVIILMLYEAVPFQWKGRHYSYPELAISFRWKGHHYSYPLWNSTLPMRRSSLFLFCMKHYLSNERSSLFLSWRKQYLSNEKIVFQSQISRILLPNTICAILGPGNWRDYWNEDHTQEECGAQEAKIRVTALKLFLPVFKNPTFLNLILKNIFNRTLNPTSDVRTSLICLTHIKDSLLCH